MKTIIKNIGIAIISCLIVGLACRKPTEYRSFLNGQELTYPGKITNPNVYTGNLRLLLTWTPSPDPSVTKYVVYWNNYADSTIVTATSHSTADTVKCLISPLAEYAYSFFIYSYDANGNRSVLTELDNARVDGPIYQSGLHNRPLDPARPAIVNPDSSATLYFLAPYDTISITTRLRYKRAAGDTATSYLSPVKDSIVLPSFKLGTQVLFQSSFIPQHGAIDTFYTLSPDTATPYKPITYVMCDKSKFSAIYLPHDLIAGFGTSLPQLWDGTMTPKGYPNIFHSDGSGSPPLPGTITMDMGQVYNNLGKVEEIGRNCCHNPAEFEVWGIADTTGAISSLLPGDGGWKADMTTKGWTLLGDIIRSDDGIAPYDALLAKNPPPVRFLIVRFVTDTDNSGYINLSQMTFWNAQ